MCAIVIIPLANASWIAPKINSQIRQREISQKFEVLAENIPQLVKRVKIQPIPLISPNLPIVDPILSRLATCESGNSPDKVILDTNGLKSYGLLQFQLKTFMSYGVKYGILPSNITADQARDLIMSPELQKELAREMLKNNLGYHWKNCMKQISLK